MQPMKSGRHCEPTNRANARPMTGSTPSRRMKAAGLKMQSSVLSFAFVSLPKLHSLSCEFPLVLCEITAMPWPLLRALEPELFHQRAPFQLLGPNVAAHVFDRGRSIRDQAKRGDLGLHLGSLHDTLPPRMKPVHH